MIITIDENKSLLETLTNYIRLQTAKLTASNIDLQQARLDLVREAAAVEAMAAQQVEAEALAQAIAEMESA